MASRDGISPRQAPHHVAQKFRKTTLPWKSVKETDFPCRSGNVKPGARWPACRPLPGSNWAKAIAAESTEPAVDGAVELIAVARLVPARSIVGVALATGTRAETFAELE